MREWCSWWRASRGFVRGIGIGCMSYLNLLLILIFAGWRPRLAAPSECKASASICVHNYRRSLVSVARFAPGYSLGLQAAWQRVGGATVLRRVGVAPRGSRPPCPGESRVSALASTRYAPDFVLISRGCGGRKPHAISENDRDSAEKQDSTCEKCRTSN